MSKNLPEKSGRKSKICWCFFLDEVQKHTKVHLINIVKETAKHINSLAQGKDVSAGLLVTDGTMRSGIYHQELQKKSIRPVAPVDVVQTKVMEVIYDQVKKTGAGSIKDFNYIVNEMLKLGCEYVILGCTEFSYFSNNYQLSSHCIDVLEVLKKISIELSGKKYKDNV